MNPSAFGLPFATLAAFVAGGSWDKGVEGLARQGKACKGRNAESWAYVSLTPGLTPCYSPMHFVNKNLREERTVKILNTVFCKLDPLPKKIVLMIGGLFNLNKCARNGG